MQSASQIARDGATLYKVLARLAENSVMKTENTPLISTNNPRYASIKALGLAIVWIRKAQGKPAPDNFDKGTSDYERALEDLSSDVFRAMCLDPEVVQFGDFAADD